MYKENIIDTIYIMGTYNNLEFYDWEQEEQACNVETRTITQSITSSDASPLARNLADASALCSTKTKTEYVINELAGKVNSNDIIWLSDTTTPDTSLPRRNLFSRPPQIADLVIFSMLSYAATIPVLEITGINTSEFTNYQMTIARSVGAVIGNIAFSKAWSIASRAPYG